MNPEIDLNKDGKADLDVSIDEDGTPVIKLLFLKSYSKLIFRYGPWIAIAHMYAQDLGVI